MNEVLVDKKNILNEKPLLKTSEEQYRNLMENLAVGIAYFDLNGLVLYLNQTASKNMGGSPEDFIGKSLYELYGQKAGKEYHNC